MEIVRTGIVIRTEKYQECVDFYTKIIGLKVTYKESKDNFKLSFLEFGGAYLLIETGGKAQPEGKAKGVDENPSVLRFDVHDALETLKMLKAHQVKTWFHDFEWGKIVIIYDPDGNEIQFKEPKP